MSNLQLLFESQPLRRGRWLGFPRSSRGSIAHLEIRPDFRRRTPGLQNNAEYAIRTKRKKTNLNLNKIILRKNQQIFHKINCYLKKGKQYFQICLYKIHLSY